MTREAAARHAAPRESSSSRGTNPKSGATPHLGLVRDDDSRHGAVELEVSIVMPCLNEADTLEACLLKAQRSLRENHLRGEIIVADNGSSDGSIEIAQRLGVRVVNVQDKGYGCALMGGIAAARGEFVVMGDADDSYDFLETGNFVRKLREGYDLVQGCRLPAGGGTVRPGAMPFLHRWLGNPMFTRMVRVMFKSPVNDVYCGLRGFRKAWYEQLGQRCGGMEFAIEMIVRTSLQGGRIGEIPVTLHPDGRKAHAPHLKTFRDGWRTLRFLLVYSPKWLFLLPGAALLLLGLIGYGLVFGGVTLAGVRFDAHTLLFASAAIFCGYQSILFAIFTKTFAIRESLLPKDPRLDRFYKVATLEKGLILSVGALLAGGGLMAAALWRWRQAGFGDLDYASTMRLAIPGATLVTLAIQTMLSSFFVSILSLTRQTAGLAQNASVDPPRAVRSRAA